MSGQTHARYLHHPCTVSQLKKLLKHHCIPTIGRIARVPGWGSYNGRPITLCPDCLNMGMCQAEMLGQRYKIKTTIQAMDALPDRQSPA